MINAKNKMFLKVVQVSFKVFWRNHQSAVSVISKRKGKIFEKL